jgi:hypothetical protein
LLKGKTGENYREFGRGKKGQIFGFREGIDTLLFLRKRAISASKSFDSV